MHIELRTADAALIGSFNERVVALRIAREVLDTTSHVVMQTVDEQDRLIAEGLVSRRGVA